jgi:peptide/nickel transport system ATP-binding protein
VCLVESDAVLRIEGLKTYFHTYEGVVRALEGVTFEVLKGETMGLVGETGCGKSVTALSVMGLIPRPPGKIEAGSVFIGEPSRVAGLRKEFDSRFGKASGDARKAMTAELEKRLEVIKGPGHEEGRKDVQEQLAALKHSYDILQMSEKELNSIRGAKISMIFQEPMTALNPTMTIGEQIGETVGLHQTDRIVDDVIRQLNLEKIALERGKKAIRQKPNSPASVRTNGSSTIEQETPPQDALCSVCGAPARSDWNACLSCGAVFKSGISSAVPRSIRRLRMRLEARHYERLKENPYSTTSYLVRRIPLVRKLAERRLKLAKLLRAEAALAEVKIAEPSRVARSYPFELSGGMKQRAMIAMMMACKPDLLIADEPTTALDVTVEAQILSLMRELKTASGTSILLITHDLGIIAENCQRVAVMYAGYIVELSSVQDIFLRPMHPYTNALLKSIPKIGSVYVQTRKKPLKVIPGVVPNLLTPPPGCRFHPRCDHVLEKCKTEVPELKEMLPGHFVACHNPVVALEEMR